MTVGLVLGGGGVKSSFEAGAVETLIKEYHQSFDIFAGIGTGALIASLLISNDFEIISEIYNQNQTRSLHDIIETEFNPQKAIDLWPMKKLLIKVLNTSTNEFKIFTNNPNQSPNNLKKAVIASVSIPFIMESVEIDGNFYADATIKSESDFDQFDNKFDKLFIITASMINKHIPPCADTICIKPFAEFDISPLDFTNSFKQDMWRAGSQMVNVVMHQYYGRKYHES